MHLPLRGGEVCGPERRFPGRREWIMKWMLTRLSSEASLGRRTNAHFHRNDRGAFKGMRPTQVTGETRERKWTASKLGYCPGLSPRPVCNYYYFFHSFVKVKGRPEGESEIISPILALSLCSNLSLHVSCVSFCFKFKTCARIQ